ncbi:aldehyde dehydrogenase family protein [Paenibacillus radicis (ex Xue et al. 2023)]|uniref:aldehyde dehydrogenase (NAD(+)) n=1 Tax=Paenibacillus radicis (ex Xue et al. 2023) TaxID=2972489 RepID=A0ABT1YH11_9BACL|nr:aldehyde dehydrogenase family protein [Paenibacillus radicis (ex Xue et al. 2023)]MCR8632015.1 aldehyde dehydrogenase family protein [Paenibacillus radicis (ex Xue et al. 2023)]
MNVYDKIYINGQFVKPVGTEELELINPVNKQPAGKVVLGNVEDTRKAIEAAKAAFKTYSKTSVEERLEMLSRLHESLSQRFDRLTEATVSEYGAPVTVAKMLTQLAINAFLHMKETAQSYPFIRAAGTAKVRMEPVGVVGVITPWNANATHLANKIAPSLAAGCTVVVKPSEFSAAQTELFMEAVHAANIPAGVINIVNGKGEVVGEELTRHPDVTGITFTGSTAIGKRIAAGAAANLKRVTLELGGKSPTVILDDADLTKAVPLAVRAGFINSGQACLAGTRVLVPETRLEEVKRLMAATVEALKVGDLWNEASVIGPMVNQKQFERVQHYITQAINDGAEVVVGGAGSPQGLEDGYYVKPTVFSNVTNDMTIAQEEVFGPVLSIITYKTEEEAIEIANDTPYGLQAFVFSGSTERGNPVAEQIMAGRISVNGLHDEPKAPFGGFKSSGIGRDHGTYGIEEYLEPKAILGHSSVM